MASAMATASVAGGRGKRKITPASARQHTRGKSNANSSPLSFTAIRPPPPKICGSPGGPPITAPRIQLRDGRHLAYKDHGVPTDQAKHSFVFIHGFDSCRNHNPFLQGLSSETVEALGIYMVSFDRPGYGESDPDPKRTGKSLALDIEELADQLNLGPKFYVVGFSMGGEIVWNCLKYIPHRLAGATLLAPVINYWWDGLPANLTSEAYKVQFEQDQWALRVTHYAPWLTYWWNTQKWFPPSSVVAHRPDLLSKQDIQILTDNAGNGLFGDGPVRQQGEYESIHRDMMIGFGSWEFSPLLHLNDSALLEGGMSVHIWQGDDDGLVPVTLQRYIANRMPPWLRYHELHGAGHLFPFAQGMPHLIINTQLSTT
ncbi:hypothetical protein V2J09_012211 [Rumex salicifolius]